MKDLFSHQSGSYLKFRPKYPIELYRFITELTKSWSLAWDCGTGNGQAAVELAKTFQQVVATDISQKQLMEAPKLPNIRYEISPAEKTNFTKGSVDLITVAQALHWFKAEEFSKEVVRVLKSQGVLAVWSYELSVIEPKVDAVVKELYKGMLGDLWEPERKHVEDGYKAFSFPLKERTSPTINMNAVWSVDHLIGYLGTWSPVQAYIKKHNQHPVEMITPQLREAWGTDATKKVIWPLNLRIWSK